MIAWDASQPGDPLGDSWRYGIAVGRAYELLRADVQEHLRWVQTSVGFRYCRFHGLFHDDMQVAVRDADKGLLFQWGQVGKVFDFLLSIGLKPFIELGSMPGALASGPETFFYWRMNVTPPARTEEWEQLVESFAHWCIRRYGSDEVRTWRFEVWNEPNLKAFWSGTYDEYCHLYRASARALSRADTELRLGGPASAEGGWIDEFLEGPARDVRTQFISTHVYPMNEFGAYANRGESPYVPGRFMTDRVRSIAAKVRDKAPGAEFLITEWNSLDAADEAGVDWFDNPTIDGIGSAAITARACVELASEVDGLFWWVASDVFEEAGMPQSPFSGTYGLVTVEGTPKPSFHIFTWLRALKGGLLKGSGKMDEGCGAVAARDGDTVRALVWNHVPPGTDSRVWDTEVRIDGIIGDPIAVCQAIRPGRGSAFESWQELGEPQDPTPVQAEYLRNCSVPEGWVVQGDTVSLRLGPNEAALIEWTGKSGYRIDKTLLSSQSIAWNTALAEAGQAGER